MLIASLLLAAAAGSATGPACIVPDGSRLQLELALSDKEKKSGLMFRDSLPVDRGMLFPFDSDGIFSFWMKDTLMPLDIVWLDASGKVADVLPDAPPCRFDPCPMFKNAQPARSVLLVNAGYSRAHGLARGAQVTFENVPSGAFAARPK
ncbi:MAG: DUF192 domain-containing protein [Acidobacteriia bacterium]|nr:DUF192 domain-containing protein [Terriglobia bacterium]